MAAGSFSAGLSGLSANSTYLSVIGNNLANINTVGYKSSTVNFADLVSQNVGGISQNPMQIGLGVTVGSISPVFSQGSIENSGVSTNAAIQGDGFFIVKNQGGGDAYTRAGDFTFDADGYMVTSDGWRVQGYTATNPTTGGIVTSGVPGDILVPKGSLKPPTATTTFSAPVNLKSDSPIDAVNPQYTMPVKVYDTMGGAHVLQVEFLHTGANAWTYRVIAPASEAPTAPVPLATGNLTFNAQGVLTGAAPAPAGPLNIPTVTYTNGGTTPAIAWDITNPDGTPNLTSYVATSAAGSITVNGNAAGQVDSLSVNSKGEIMATINGGGSLVVGQLAMANFNNPQGLVKMGANKYGETAAAGVANVGVPGTGGRGTMTGSALESSNVDIAQEFTKMILAQRGYQANSRSITTADEVLQETLNMKR